MRLWWDLVDGDDGYGYPWGRSLGVVSYMDTLEIVAFLAQHPEFRPAPLADLVSQYARAWNYLRHDFKDDRHLLSLFDFGRGNYRLHLARSRVAADDRVPRQGAGRECRARAGRWSARG